ncbi:MAG: histidinol dehydrogenase, partial [Nitrospirota bacterium]|nr:histidinol dehydrogenase [Nitrospirota bacterium]
MTVEYLKKASRTAKSDESETRARVAALLDDLEAGGENATRSLAEKFDHWTGDIVVAPDALAAASAMVPEQLKADIRFAHDRVRRFAEAQLASVQAFETELAPGLIAGQRLIPIRTAGCYVPGGRFAHIASAIMSVTTAR